MYEDRLKKISKYKTSIEKKKSVIAQKKKRCEEMALVKLTSLFKKFNTDKLTVKFEKIKKKTYYSYLSNNAPDLIINYGDYYVKINNDGEIGSLSDWYGFGQDSRNDWYDYLILLGYFVDAMKKKKAIHTFFSKKFKELGVLHKDLEEYTKEFEDFERITDDLIKSKKKGYIEEIIKEGMSFEFPKSYIGSLASVTSLTINSIKNKTYQCSVYGVKYRESFTYHQWHEIYVKHEDLHSLILNNTDSWGTGFKREFNLEMTLN